MFDIRRSNLYTIWLLERAEISKNLWYLSEKSGFDVGWHAAKFDWEMRFRADWIAGLKISGIYPR